MKGILSLHPVDPAFFEGVVAPLVAGRKINPEPFLVEAIEMRAHLARARRIPRALAALLHDAEYKEAPSDAPMLQRLRSKLERFDHKPDALAVIATEKVDPDLHLRGRPFFIVETAAERVAEVIDEYRWAPRPEAVDDIAGTQLERLDRTLAAQMAPAEEEPLPPDMVLRAELLAELKALHDLGRAAREGGRWNRDSGSISGSQALAEELPWRAIALHARIVPFWEAVSAAGLEAICRAAGVTSPEVLLPPQRLFAEACDLVPALGGALKVEAKGARDVGGFVAPDDIPRLLAFLAGEGARIIQAATREGEGPACTLLLRKMKECATYAKRHGLGYLEASGVPTPLREEDRDA